MGVPIYNSDFDEAQHAVYEPVGADVFLNIPLWLLLTLLLLLAAVAYGGWLMGGQGRREADPCDDIVRAIGKRIEAALAAPRDQVMARANDLKRALDSELGPVLAFGRMLDGPYDRLSRALDGKPSGHGAHADHDPHHDHDADHDDKGHGDGHGSAPSRIVIHADTVHLSGRDDPHEGRGGGHDAGGLTSDQQIDAVRAAVHALADNWSSDDPKGKLRAVRNLLTRERPSKPLSKAHDGH